MFTSQLTEHLASNGIPGGRGMTHSRHHRLARAINYWFVNDLRWFRDFFQLILVKFTGSKPQPKHSLCNVLWLMACCCNYAFGTSAFYSRQLCRCPFPAYSVFSPGTSFPSTKWSETCTTTLILLISVSFETIWGGGCNMHFYHAFWQGCGLQDFSLLRLLETTGL